MEREILDEPTVERVEPHTDSAPKPTYAPFLAALGITMTFWGLATSPVMSASGLIVLAWGLASWIRSIANAWRDSDAHES